MMVLYLGVYYTVGLILVWGCIQRQLNLHTLTVGTLKSGVAAWGAGSIEGMTGLLWILTMTLTHAVHPKPACGTCWNKDSWQSPARYIVISTILYIHCRPVPSIQSTMYSFFTGLRMLLLSITFLWFGQDFCRSILYKSYFYYIHIIY